MGLERARRTAEARIEQLQHELQSAKGQRSRPLVRSFVGDLTSLTRCIAAWDSTKTVRISC